MTMAMILAARGQASGAEIVIGLVIILVVALIAIVMGASAHYDVLIKNGLPYCPRCNRQVTYRRDHCRACGYKYKTYGGPPGDPAAQQPNSRQLAERKRVAQLQEFERSKKERLAGAENAARRAERDKAYIAMGIQPGPWAWRTARRAARRAERDEAYRARGIEPGPWAWYQALPAVQQAIILGLAFGLPTGMILILIFHLFAPLGRR
jgi:hypothetical protein